MKWSMPIATNNRLLQQNRHLCDISTASNNVRSQGVTPEEFAQTEFF